MKHILKQITLLAMLIAYMPAHTMNWTAATKPGNKSNASTSQKKSHLLEPLSDDDDVPKATRLERERQAFAQESIGLSASSAHAGALPIIHPTDHTDADSKPSYQQSSHSQNNSFILSLSDDEEVSLNGLQEQQSNPTDAEKFSITEKDQKEHQQHLITIQELLCLPAMQEQTHKDDKTEPAVTLSVYEQDLFDLRSEHNSVTVRLDNNGHTQTMPYEKAQELQEIEIGQLIKQCTEEVSTPLQKLLTGWQELIATDAQHTSLLDILIATTTEWMQDPTKFTPEQYAHLMTLIDTQYALLFPAINSLKEVQKSATVTKLAHIYLTHKEVLSFSSDAEKSIKQYLQFNPWKEQKSVNDYVSNNPAIQAFGTINYYYNTLCDLAIIMHHTAQQAKKLKKKNITPQPLSGLFDADSAACIPITASIMGDRVQRYKESITESLNTMQEAISNNTSSQPIYPKFLGNLYTIFFAHHQSQQLPHLQDALYTSQTPQQGTQQSAQKPNSNAIKKQFEQIKHECITTLEKQQNLKYQFQNYAGAGSLESWQQSPYFHLSMSSTHGTKALKQVILAHHKAVIDTQHKAESLRDQFSAETESDYQLQAQIGDMITGMETYQSDLTHLAMQAIHVHANTQKSANEELYPAIDPYIIEGFSDTDDEVERKLNAATHTVDVRSHTHDTSTTTDTSTDHKIPKRKKATNQTPVTVVTNHATHENGDNSEQTGTSSTQRFTEQRTDNLKKQQQSPSATTNGTINAQTHSTQPAQSTTHNTPVHVTAQSAPISTAHASTPGEIVKQRQRQTDVTDTVLSSQQSTSVSSNAIESTRKTSAGTPSTPVLPVNADTTPASITKQKPTTLKTKTKTPPTKSTVSPTPTTSSISATKIGMLSAGILGGAYAAYAYLPTLITQIKTGQWRQWFNHKQKIVTTHVDTDTAQKITATH